MKQALSQTSKPSRGCRGITWRAGLNRFQSCVLRSLCARYSCATGSQEMKVVSRTRTSFQLNSWPWSSSCSLSVLGQVTWTQTLHPELLQWHLLALWGDALLAGDASLQLCKAGTLDVSPALYDSVNDSKTKLIGNPKTLVCGSKMPLKWKF